MDKIDLALEIINLKIAKEVKKNTEKKYSEFAKKIKVLEDEKRAIYQNNEAVIKRVIDVYGKEAYVKNGDLLNYSDMINKWNNQLGSDPDFAACYREIITADNLGGIIEQPSKLSSFKETAIFAKSSTGTQFLCTNSDNSFFDKVVISTSCPNLSLTCLK